MRGRRLVAAVPRGVLLGIALGLVALAAAPALASSGPVPPAGDPFYTYTGSLTRIAPGTVLRSRTVAIAQSGTATPMSAMQVLYRTTGQYGQPTATITTIIQPAASTGTAEIVSYQTAYDALGAQCDPSYTLQGGNPSDSTAQAELQAILAYVRAGDTVVVPDYEGERLDWAAGQESGWNTLDGIRATENLLGLPQTGTPVAMLGYSGGSIATEFASELAPAYAPRLDIVAAAEGGVPVDLFHNTSYINGDKDWAGTIPAVLVSLSRAYGISFRQYLSPLGLTITNQVKAECIASFATHYPGLTIQKLLKPRYRNYTRLHDLTAITDHIIMGGSGTPRSPLFIGVGNFDGTGDGIMVTKDDEALAHAYCKRGVSVQFNVYSGDDHVHAAVPFEVGAFTFISQRLGGMPVSDGCGSIGTGNSIAPLPIRPALTLAFAGGQSCAAGLELRLASTAGTLSDVVLTLAHNGKSIATSKLAQLPMSARALILSDHGRRLSGGRYTLTISEGGLTLLTRALRISGQSGCVA